MTARPLYPGVPSAGHISGGYWHPGPIDGCVKCPTPKSRMGHEPGLYFSADGRIECADHAPAAGSDTWRAGNYVRIRTGIELEWRREQARTGLNLPLRCETCGRSRLEAERA